MFIGFAVTDSFRGPAFEGSGAAVLRQARKTFPIPSAGTSTDIRRKTGDDGEAINRYSPRCFGGGNERRQQGIQAAFSAVSLGTRDG